MRRSFLRKSAAPKKRVKTAGKSVTPVREGAKATGNAGAAPLTEAQASKSSSMSRMKAPKPKKIRKEELNFSVTQAFRRKFKQAAREAGHKKSVFLEILLMHWEECEQIPPSGASL
jgi:hypothetical protein